MFMKIECGNDLQNVVCPLPLSSLTVVPNLYLDGFFGGRGKERGKEVETCGERWHPFLGQDFNSFGKVFENAN